ncbi:MAG TPA: hypothetical protein VJ653_02545 [Acidimicrobiales bacterium]|nr:hypothetical protein [Acidimicrobiales bacterium]
MAHPLQWARRTVVAVFLLGLVVVVGPAVWNADSLFRDPFTGAQERTTVETFDAAGNRTGTEVTTSPAGGSLIERSLASGGVLLLRLAVVAAAAYLAGALVYRTMSGTFPSEIGGVKFAEDAAVGLEKMEANVEVVRDQVTQVSARLGAADAELAAMRLAAAGGAAAVTEFGERLDAAQEGIERLAEAVVVLGEELRRVSDRRSGAS